VNLTPDTDWMPLIVIAATVAVMVYLLRRMMRGMNQQDWILLRQARTRGVDVSQPQAVDFVVFAASHEIALELAGLMRQDGYDTHITEAQIQYTRTKRKQPGPAQAGWLVKGTRVIRLVPEELIGIRKSLDELALARQAAYLGWQIGFGQDAKPSTPAAG
jgi:hypothetical protein